MAGFISSRRQPRLPIIRRHERAHGSYRPTKSGLSYADWLIANVEQLTKLARREILCFEDVDLQDPSSTKPMPACEGCDLQSEDLRDVHGTLLCQDCRDQARKDAPELFLEDWA